MNSTGGSCETLVPVVVGFLRSRVSQSYLAGGYVRDRLLGHTARDVDIVVPGGAIQLARELADATGGRFYILDRGTDAARVVYPSLAADCTIDVAAMRAPDIVADLRLRDFTINAMALEVQDALKPLSSVIDPCGGRADLRAQILRVTHRGAFADDPVRLLRAVRFVATLGLSIDVETRQWIAQDAPLLERSSAERVRDELAIIFAAPRTAAHLGLMQELGLLAPLLPEVLAQEGAEAPAAAVGDAWAKTLARVHEAERLSAWPRPTLAPLENEYLGAFAQQLALHFAEPFPEGRTRRVLVEVAALLLDLGRDPAHSRRVDAHVEAGGKPVPGPRAVEEVLRRWRFSGREVRLVGQMLRHHLRPSWLLRAAPVTRRAVYRYFRDCGEVGVDVLLLALADEVAELGSRPPEMRRRSYLDLARRLLEGYFHNPQQEVAPPELVDGRDVMEIVGIPAGPQVGKVLEALREAQASGEVGDREGALRFLRDL